MWLFVYGFEDLWFLFLVFPFFAHINVRESDNFLDFKFVNGSILMNLFLSLFSGILIFSIFGSTYRSDYEIANLSIYIDFVKELCRIPCHGNLYIESKSEFYIFQLPTQDQDGIRASIWPGSEIKIWLSSIWLVSSEFWASLSFNIWGKM